MNGSDGLLSIFLQGLAFCRDFRKICVLSGSLVELSLSSAMIHICRAARSRLLQCRQYVPVFVHSTCVHNFVRSTLLSLRISPSAGTPDQHTGLGVSTRRLRRFSF